MTIFAVDILTNEKQTAIFWGTKKSCFLVLHWPASLCRAVVRNARAKTMKNKIIIILLIIISQLGLCQNKNDKNNIISIDLLKNINIDEININNLTNLTNYKEKITVFTSKDIIKYDKNKKILIIKKIDLNKLYRKPLLIKLKNDLLIGCFDNILYSSVNPILYKCKIIFWSYIEMNDKIKYNKNETILKIEFKDKIFEKKRNKIFNN